MADAVLGCGESNDNNIHLMDNNVGFQSQNFMNSSPTNTNYKDVDPIIPTSSSNSEELNNYDGITEVSKTFPNELRNPSDANIFHTNDLKELHFNFAKDVFLDVKVDGCVEVNPLNNFKSLELCNHTEDIPGEFIKFSNVHITELKHEIKVPSEQIEENIKIRKPVFRVRTINNDSDCPYEKVSERIKKLSAYQSLDNDHHKFSGTEYNNHKGSSSIETKKLSMDSTFTQKMSEIYSPSPIKSFSVSNIGPVNIRNDRKLTLIRHDSNCEIIEENLSPVSETARQLQQQLSFPSSPISPDRSPRIPKMSRFARLNRLLNQTPEPEIPILTESTNANNPTD